MCGLTGFLQYQAFRKNDAIPIVEKMLRSILHRGPDDSGIWIDDSIGVAIGHNRLSIVDLSAAGHQPMTSHSGRYVIAYNGEIYNHLSLRSELDSRTRIHWRGHSDTETLIAGIEEWGLVETLEKAVGMYAIVLWDKKEEKLYLARDRMGEKPLYYGWQNGVFLFGSELKSLKAHPKFKAEIDRDILSNYFCFSYVPAPNSIYNEIFKLPMSSYLVISREDKFAKPKRYWSLEQKAEEGQKFLFKESDSGAIRLLDSKIRESVALQMLADVPLGAFLSGGIDSSTIVAIMQSLSTRPIKTFTIGFSEEQYNEAEHAKLIAKHLGTEHTELYINPQEARDVIPKLPTIYDEPFSDSSQIPTFLVSEMARRHVTVSLSGDAGDELFGGYNRYFWTKSIWNKIKRIPMPLRKVVSFTMQKVSPTEWNNFYSIVHTILPRNQNWKVSQPGDKIHKLAGILALPTLERIYYKLISHWDIEDNIVILKSGKSSIFEKKIPATAFDEIENKMMYMDSITYLPDDILVKVDRAAMNVSLETRVPFLDHRMVEFAWRLPLHFKIREGVGKWLLRQVLYQYIPKELVERPKMGFGVPIDSWLRGPLCEWAGELLDESRLKKEGYLNARPIQKKWKEHLSGSHNWQHHLWDILMFQSWLEKNKN